MQKYNDYKAFRDLLEDLKMTAHIHYKYCPDFLNGHKDENGGVTLIVSNTNTSSCLFYIDNELGETLQIDFLYRGARKLLYIPIEDIDYIYAEENSNINIGVNFNSYQELLKALYKTDWFIEHLFNSNKNYLNDKNNQEGLIIKQDSRNNKPVKIKPNYLKLVVSNKLKDIKPCNREIIRNFHIV